MSLWLSGRPGSLNTVSSHSLTSELVGAVNIKRNNFIDGLTMFQAAAGLPFHVAYLTIANVSSLSPFMSKEIHLTT